MSNLVTTDLIFFPHTPEDRMRLRIYAKREEDAIKASNLANRQLSNACKTNYKSFKAEGSLKDYGVLLECLGIYPGYLIPGSSSNTYWRVTSFLIGEYFEQIENVSSKELEAHLKQLKSEILQKKASYPADIFDLAVDAAKKLESHIKAVQQQSSNTPKNRSITTNGQTLTGSSIKTRIHVRDLNQQFDEIGQSDTSTEANRQTDTTSSSENKATRENLAEKMAPSGDSTCLQVIKKIYEIATRIFSSIWNGISSVIRFLIIEKNAIPTHPRTEREFSDVNGVNQHQEEQIKAFVKDPNTVETNFESHPLMIALHRRIEFLEKIGTPLTKSEIERLENLLINNIKNKKSERLHIEESNVMPTTPASASNQSQTNASQN